jgi:hypothetical protein
VASDLQEEAEGQEGATAGQEGATAEQEGATAGRDGDAPLG